VIVWSLGNEAGFGKNFMDAYQWIKNEDKSRPVQYEQAHGKDGTDIYCPMYLGYERCEKYSADEKSTKPLIQCEYAHAMGNSQGGFREYWDLIRKYPKYQGGYIWDFVDQGLRKKLNSGVEVYAYGGDFNPYDASDNNFLNNGLVSPDRKFNPHAFEVQHFYQNIWTKPIDLQKGRISVFNENFFIGLNDFYAEWELLADGKIYKSGVINEFNIQPQENKEFQLNYDITGCDKELILNIQFKRKTTDGLLPAGFIIARNEHIIQLKQQADIKFSEKISKNEKEVIPVVKENDYRYLKVSGNDFILEFNKFNGFLSKFEFRGNQLMAEESNLSPNFWRAPVDNDYGANLQRKWSAWKNTGIKLDSIKNITENGIVKISCYYKMNNVSSALMTQYQINSSGEIIYSQKMNKLDSAKVTDMFRFGFRMQMPDSYSLIEYYGRGPFENYADRNNASFLGLYRQTVEEQYYPYVRPQESGTKTDIRYWKVINKSGKGLKFEADNAFSASTLFYSMEELDNGPEKTQRHGADVKKSGNTEICIDKAQMGVGCVTSWGALPLEKYRLKCQDYQFSIKISPL
jgi:beta-galactosidase